MTTWVASAGTCSAACLVPCRKGKLLIRQQRNSNVVNPQEHSIKSSFVTLWKQQQKCDDRKQSKPNFVILGRRELIQSMRQACGCDPICHDCLTVESWALKRVSRQMVRVLHCEKRTTDGEETPSDDTALLSVRGPNAFLVRVDREPIVKEVPIQDNSGWIGNAKVSVGSRITVGAVQQQDVGVLEFQLMLVDLKTGHVLTEPRRSTRKRVTPIASCLKKPKQRDSAGTSSTSEVIDLTDSPPPGTKKVRLNLQDSQYEEAGKDVKNTKRATITAAAASLNTAAMLTGRSRDKKKSYCLYFLPLGRNMPPSRIQFLKQSAKRLGAMVVESLDGPPIPTHLVLDGTLPPSAVADWLGFSSSQELSDALHERNMQAVKPSWVAQAGDTLQEPRWGMFYSGIAFQSKRKRKQVQSSTPSDTTKRQKQEYSSHDNVNKVNEPAAVVEIDLTNDEFEVPISNGRNAGLSELFTKLAKLHQDCHLEALDEWKAYTFSVIAGRVRQLDFEIVDDDKVLARVADIKGFGASAMKHIREYLKTGTCQRLHEFQKDPMRVAMERFTHIWGVGKMKAKELINMGFASIAQVRAGVTAGLLSDLSPNQLIGLDCYEDFREKMSRVEVEMIGDIVSKACRERYPKAIVTIMGSYRRGKPTSGDVDILVTHPNFVATTPKGALSELVDRLKKRGHIAHHLTHAYGLTAGEDSTDASQDFEGVDAVENGYPSSSTYMGVFFSPLVPGMRRRIDIKFYPYRERVFASLYFTGNGHFNRSMRLYTGKVKGLRLNDHGLFPRTGNVSIPRPSDKLMLEPSTEKEVFDFLGLEYKDVHERDCFDAVVPIDEDVRSKLGMEQLNQSELKRDGSNHQWID